MSVGDLAEREERPAWVQFETRPIEDTEATKEAGHWVGKDVDYVLVTPPYSKDCFEHKAEKWFETVRMNVRNKRVPEIWLKQWEQAYQLWKQGKEIPLNGTPIKEWSVASPAQIKTILSSGIRTIEDLAAANDEGLKRIGMGSIDLRNKAKAWLQASKDKGSVVLENSELKNKVSQLEGTIESLKTQMASITNDLRVQKGEPVSNEITIDDIMDDSDILSFDEMKEKYKQMKGRYPHPNTSEAKLREIVNG